VLPELVIRFSINNQISLGLQNVFRKPKNVYSSPPKISDRYEFSRIRKKYEKAAIAAKSESFEGRLDRLFPPPLDIKYKSQRPHKTRKIRAGFNRSLSSGVPEKIPPFGSKQGQKIREAGAAIDLLKAKKGGAARIVTLTLVGDTPEAFEALAANSGYIVNRLFQIVRRHGGDCKNWFFVWEFQKRGALHLHICLWHEVPNLAAKLGAKLVQAWHKILKDIEIESGIDMFVRRDLRGYTPRQKWQSRNEPMRKSAGGYFSKYATKGSSSEGRKTIAFWASKYPPSRFWGSSQSIKNIIKEESFEYRFESHKSEASKYYHERIEALLSQFEIAHYGTHEWKFQKGLFDSKGNPDGSRTITEGFIQNFYFLPREFERAKSAILHELLSQD
jgi:hypothetical protein